MAAIPTPGPRPAIAAEAFLRALADHGTDNLFANPGTDFPPIVEAFSRAKKTNAKVPMPVLVPHENLAVAMAHGAYLMNGVRGRSTGRRKCSTRPVWCANW